MQEPVALSCRKPIRPSQKRFRVPGAASNFECNYFQVTTEAGEDKLNSKAVAPKLDSIDFLTGAESDNKVYSSIRPDF